MKQTTLKQEVTVSGVGLHTGQKVNMTFCPAPENHWYKFQRIDLPEQPVVDADVDNVVDTSRGTTIEQKGARINTVEHVLAALVGLEIDNCLIKLDGPEPPIMDGSSIMFMDALQQAGIEIQEADREYFTVPQNILYQEAVRGVELIAMPIDGCRLPVMLD